MLPWPTKMPRKGGGGWFLLQSGYHKSNCLLGKAGMFRGGIGSAIVSGAAFLYFQSTLFWEGFIDAPNFNVPKSWA